MNLTTYKLYAFGEHFNVYLPMPVKEEGFQEKPKREREREKREGRYAIGFLWSGRHLGTANQQQQDKVAHGGHVKEQEIPLQLHVPMTFYRSNSFLPRARPPCLFAFYFLSKSPLFT